MHKFEIAEVDDFLGRKFLKILGTAVLMEGDLNRDSKRSGRGWTKEELHAIADGINASGEAAVTVIRGLRDALQAILNSEDDEPLLVSTGTIQGMLDTTVKFLEAPTPKNTARPVVNTKLGKCVPPLDADRDTVIAYIKSLQPGDRVVEHSMSALHGIRGTVYHDDVGLACVKWDPVKPGDGRLGTSVTGGARKVTLVNLDQVTQDQAIQEGWCLGYSTATGACISSMASGEFKSDVEAAAFVEAEAKLGSPYHMDMLLKVKLINEERRTVQP